MGTNMWGDVIAGGIIGAGASVASQFVSAWSKSQSDRYIKKVEYLQNAQSELIKLIEQEFVFLPSFDEEEIIARSVSFYSDANPDKFLNDKFLSGYRTLMHNFMLYRHYIQPNLRQKCDSYFKQLQKATLEAGDLRKVISLPEQHKKDLVVNLHTLTCLVFLGIVKALESISDQVTK